MNPDIRHIRNHAIHHQGGMLGAFDSFLLHTALQPIFSIAHKRIVGYEALARGEDAYGRPVDLAELFSPKRDESSQIFLDRLCRYVHIHNFVTSSKDTLNWLFLNVSPRIVLQRKQHGSFFAELLASAGLPPHRVVIEIVEHPISDHGLLLETVNHFKHIGCLIAIDDFGSGYSNFERVWSLTPDIIKLDRSMIVRADEQKKIRKILPGIVSLLHQAGCMVLIEGVETEDQAMIALECEADMVQGFFFAKPATDFGVFKKLSQPFDKLFERYKDAAMAEQEEILKMYDHYLSLCQNAITRILSGSNLENACVELLADPAVMRCYLLLPNGIQIGHSVTSQTYRKMADIRFKPLYDANSADWFRHHYLRRAIVHPNQLKFTRPYLSVTGAHLCVTLSMMFSTASGNRIFCCDLNWE